MPNITIKEIAARVGISVSTVSRILNNKKGFQVKESTRNRVFSLVEEMGYQPNLAAKSLRSGKRYAIGVSGTGSLAGMNDFHASLIYAGIGRVAEEHGYFLSFFPQGKNFKDDLVKAARHNMVDGLIIVNYPRHYEEFSNTVVPMLHTEEMPFVVVHSMGVPYDCHNIGYDHVKAGVLGTRHLIERGYRKIRLLGQGDPFVDGVVKGYRGVMREAGLDPVEYVFEGIHCSARKGYEWGKDILTRSDRADAYLITHDFFAMGFMDALRETGDGPGVVTCGDFLKDGQIVIPRLTSVSRFPTEQGVKAARILFNAIEGTAGAGWHRHIFEPEIVIRESSDTIVRKEEA